MLKDLKVSSLACKRVFYRSEHNAKGGPYGTELSRSWKAEMNKTRKKNGVICLVIMFTLRFMFIKKSQVGHFYYFCSWYQKVSHSLRATV